MALQLMQLQFIRIQSSDLLVHRRELNGDGVVPRQARSQVSFRLVAVGLHGIGLRSLHSGDVCLALKHSLAGCIDCGRAAVMRLSILLPLLVGLHHTL